jgi:hypothetical protein
VTSFGIDFALDKIPVPVATFLFELETSQWRGALLGVGWANPNEAIAASFVRNFVGAD